MKVEMTPLTPRQLVQMQDYGYITGPERWSLVFESEDEAMFALETLTKLMEHVE